MKTTSRWSVWESIELHEHPERAGEWGTVCLADAGAYRLRQGGVWLSCPQAWAAKIHAGEQTLRRRLREVRDLLEKTKSAFHSADVGRARAIIEGLLEGEGEKYD